MSTNTARTVLAGIVLAATLATGGLSSEAVTTVTSMNDFIWQNRPLIVFAPTDEHALLARQAEALHGHLDALRERDMVVIAVVGQTTSVDGVATPELMADALRRRYGVAAGEAMALLVGKDGGVKLRQPQAFKASTLFETIDAMPMRRQEMKSRGLNSE